MGFFVSFMYGEQSVPTDGGENKRVGRLRGEEMKDVKTWSVVSREARRSADLLL